MEFGKGVFEVKATSGNTQLGGTDMDKLIFEHLAARFRERTGIDVRSDRVAAARLKEAAEVAKVELSTNTTTNITLPFLAVQVHIPERLSERQRSLFEQLRAAGSKQRASS